MKPGISNVAVILTSSKTSDVANEDPASPADGEVERYRACLRAALHGIDYPVAQPTDGQGGQSPPDHSSWSHGRVETP